MKHLYTCRWFSNIMNAILVISFFSSFSSHMIREKGAKCFKCCCNSVHTSYYPSVSEALRGNKNFKSAISIAQYSAPCPSLLLKRARLPKAQFIHMLKKKKKTNRCRTRPGCCNLVHGVTFDCSSSHIWSHFPEHELCVSLTQSVTFSAPYLT